MNELVLRDLGQLPAQYQQWYGALPPEVQGRVEQAIRRTGYGLHSVAPIRCYGPTRCPFYDACPIPEQRQGIQNRPPDEHFPLGQQCVLEGQYMAQKVAEYLMHLQVDTANPVEFAIVNELALIDLQKNRVLLILSHGDTHGQGRDFMITQQLVTGFDQNGDPIYSETRTLHPLTEQIDKLEKRREKWLDKLLQTRKSQADVAAKLGRRVQESDLLKSVQEVRQAVNMIKVHDEIPLEIR